MMLLQSKRGYGLYFVNGRDGLQRDLKVNVGDIVMVLSDKSYYNSCVVVLCKYGIKEIMNQMNEWSPL